MARYNPVFAPCIATIRSPTGIKLNCAELENKVGEIRQDKDRGGKENQCEHQTVAVYCHSVCLSLLYWAEWLLSHRWCCISFKLKYCDFLAFVFMQTQHYVTFTVLYTASPKRAYSRGSPINYCGCWSNTFALLKLQRLQKVCSHQETKIKVQIHVEKEADKILTFYVTLQSQGPVAQCDNCLCSVWL